MSNSNSTSQNIHQQEAIAAIATPVGEGGISVIRISGRDAIEKATTVFRGKNLSKVASHTVHFGNIMRGDQKVDEVLATVFRSPRSYTGEDTIEISCHGGVLVTQEVLETILAVGVRSAEPGEFTQRAFLNGKLELSQAEAVADLIHAKSRKAVEAAQQQLDGNLGSHVRAFRQQIIDATAMVELELDFIEEDVEFASKPQLIKLLHDLNSEIDLLLATYETGRLVKNGIRTVFAGKPNAGKSTLLNALMGRERAIVSDIAGTTRDVIDADWSLDGLLFTLTDTAGLRETVDQIEAEGVRRSEAAMQEADLIVYMVDLSQPEDATEIETISKLRNRFPGKSVLILGNKIDKSRAEGNLGTLIDLSISATNGTAIEELKQRMKIAVLQNRDIDTSGLLVTSSRHRDALEKTRTHITDALLAIESGVSGDFISIDLRGALHELGTITGEITTEDLLDSIFSRFCIGK
ncbi:MAG: tRNA uridine-5-carboxymethylaminomethyl(34) synthesis GTPase MnmE [Balneolales bacterium]|nr:tRNA uridine-5-carboxymethylaminomethyl(34) synthesis GTPase MnmE [Balneolales bacterium]